MGRLADLASSKLLRSFDDELADDGMGELVPVELASSGAAAPSDLIRAFGLCLSSTTMMLAKGEVGSVFDFSLPTRGRTHNNNIVVSSLASVSLLVGSSSALVLGWPKLPCCSFHPHFLLLLDRVPTNGELEKQ